MQIQGFMMTERLIFIITTAAVDVVVLDFQDVIPVIILIMIVIKYPLKGFLLNVSDRKSSHGKKDSLICPPALSQDGNEGRRNNSSCSLT